MGMAQGSVVVYPAMHYLQQSDSPFYAGIQAGTIIVENCEDQLFNTPFVSSPNAAISTNYRYSVDEDDGNLDGFGFGYAFARNTIIEIPLTFNFTADASGHFPRYVGLVITSETKSQISPFNNVDVLGVFSFDGSNLISNHQFTLPTSSSSINLNSSYWATFIGVYAEEGISQITLNNATRVDHLQYGYSIPEASSLVTLSAVGLAGLAFRRRRAQIYG